MARTVTRATLRTRIQQRADVENDGHVTSTEINDLINEAITELYDVLVAAAPPDYYLTAASPIPTVSGTLAYNLPSDFYKVRAVWIDAGSNRRRPLYPIDTNDRLWYSPPTTVESVLLEYIPASPLLTADSGSGGTFDGIDGWEEAVVLHCAIDILNKKDRDASALERKYGRVMARIHSLAARDASDTGGITRASNSRDPWNLWQGNVIAYRIRNSTIELYKGEAQYPVGV